MERLWAFRRRAGDPGDAVPDTGVLDAFRAAMDDDFDNAAALAVVFDAVRAGNRMLDAGGDPGSLVAAYDELMRVLGLVEGAGSLSDLADRLAGLAARFASPGESPEGQVEGLLAARTAARDARDWATADGIRDALADLGIVVEDGAGGSRWHRA